MTDKPERFREGATAFRNLRDLAQTHRDEFIDQANHAARHAPPESPYAALTGSRTSLSVLREGGSDTSADELAADELTIKRTRYAPPAQSRRDPATSGHIVTSTSNVAPRSTTRSRHAADNSVTPGCTTTKTSNVAPHHNTRSQNAVDDSAEEPRMRTRPSQKPLGGIRHAPDARDRN